MTPPAVLVTAFLPTPVGRLLVVVDPAGVVRGSAFGPRADLTSRVGAARPMDPSDLPGEVTDAVARYSAGDTDALCGVAVRQPGGGFHQAVWSAIRTIPAGSTVSYAELAALAGRPTAVRAAASACARNLVAPFVPCHRVVRSDGSLGGYAYGAEVKRGLLVHEQADAAGGGIGAVGRT
jgi:methylated-DNA-[protein]-cysteine S-methyltransferase